VFEGESQASGHQGQDGWRVQDEEEEEEEEEAGDAARRDEEAGTWRI
jgi:hypothetical protein